MESLGGFYNYRANVLSSTDARVIQIIIYHFEIKVAKATNGQKNGSVPVEESRANVNFQTFLAAFASLFILG